MYFRTPAEYYDGLVLGPIGDSSRVLVSLYGIELCSSAAPSSCASRSASWSVLTLIRSLFSSANRCAHAYARTHIHAYVRSLTKVKVARPDTFSGELTSSTVAESFLSENEAGAVTIEFDMRDPGGYCETDLNGVLADGLCYFRVTSPDKTPYGGHAQCAAVALGIPQRSDDGAIVSIASSAENAAAALATGSEEPWIGLELDVDIPVRSSRNTTRRCRSGAILGPDGAYILSSSFLYLALSLTIVLPQTTATCTLPQPIPTTFEVSLKLPVTASYSTVTRSLSAGYAAAWLAFFRMVRAYMPLLASLMRMQALGRGWDIATINSAQENSFVAALNALRTTSPFTDLVWIGLQRIGQGMTHVQAQILL